MTRYLSVVICAFFSLVSVTPAFASSGVQRTAGGYESGVTATDKDPVSMGNGELIQRLPLISLGGPMGLDFSVDYNSNRPTLIGYKGPKSPFSAWHLRWNHNQVRRLVEINDLTGDNPVPYINYFLGDETVVFKGDGTGGFESVGPIPYQMKKDGDISWLADPQRELVHIFRTREYTMDFGPELVTRNGELLYTLDRNGNRLTYTYNAENLLTSVSDGLGRTLNFTYVVNSLFYKLVDTVSDGQGRSVTFDFSSLDGCSAQYDFLSSITDPIGNKTTIDYTVLQEWECDYIHSITRPLGNTPAQQSWDTNRRVAGQTDALGNTTSFAWNVDPNGVVAATITDPDTTQRAWSHAQERYPTAMTDGSGKSASVAYDLNNRMTGITDREGDSIALGWHADSGMLSSLKNAEGYTLSNGYAARQQTFTHPVTGATATFTFYDRNRVDSPDGSFEIFVHDDHGNPTQYTDPRGKIWIYTYNNRGQTLTAANPEGGVTSYTYNVDATLATRTDSDTGTTTYGYDGSKRLNLITRPDGHTVAVAYDLNDHITSVTDENGNTVQYAYDANGNGTRTTDAAGNAIDYGYDLMDRVTTIDDRLDKRSSVTYDSLGRVASNTDPNGLTKRYAYNTQGWLRGTTLGGATWLTDYDDEGIPTRKTTPSGLDVQIQSNKLGITTAVTDPLGHTASFTRDSLSRVTAIADPLNRITRYLYDPAGDLAGVTLPGGEATSYSRNGLGLLKEISDLGGNIWSYNYTAMGRPTEFFDPLGRKKSWAYDALGRQVSTTFADGTSTTYTYDAIGNLIRNQYSEGPDLKFSYDSLNRPTQTNDLELTYDAEGNITNTKTSGVSFSDTYDDGGRLSSIGYADGAFTVTYTYDVATGLLTGVADSLTGSQYAFTYDQDRNLVGITRPNGVNTGYTRDGAGRVTRIQDGNIIDLNFTWNAAGEITTIGGEQPLSPEDLLTDRTVTFAFDVASQINGGGYLYDQRGRMIANPQNNFAWDGASRVIRIGDVNLTYDGLGGLLTRTEGGTTIRYHLNHAIDRSPIVAEYNQTQGIWKRYYVWTPSGMLLYTIDAADKTVSHYHFDQVGNTLALTNNLGTVVDSYAYTPFGTVLAHHGQSSQSFTFSGAYGVRQEQDLFHMKRRYYDPVAAKFLSTEPIWPQLTQALSLNPYLYAHNNPLIYVDPEGEDFGISLLIGVGVAYLASSIVVLVIELATWPEEKKRLDKSVQECKVRWNETNKRIKEILDKLEADEASSTTGQAELNRQALKRADRHNRQEEDRREKKRRFEGKRALVRKIERLWKSSHKYFYEEDMVKSVREIVENNVHYNSYTGNWEVLWDTTW